MELLERSFGSWLVGKYGTIDRAFASWSGNGLYGRLRTRQIRGDAPAAGRVGLMSAGDLAAQPGPRARDTAAFLAGVQRAYYDQMQGFLKQELGFQGSVTGSNWITADPRILGPLDKWSNAGCDFIDRHGYFDGLHQGENAAFSLSKGDRLQRRLGAAVRNRQARRDGVAIFVRSSISRTTGSPPRSAS